MKLYTLTAGHLIFPSYLQNFAIAMVVSFQIDNIAHGGNLKQNYFDTCPLRAEKSRGNVG